MNGKVRRTLSLIFMLAVLAGGILLFPCARVLVFEKVKNPSERIFSRDGLNGFCIGYTHSVNKGRVHDYYIVEGRSIVLIRTEFVSYGAGMPEPEDAEGAVFVVGDGSYSMNHVRNLGREFFLAVGAIADHSLAFAGNDGTYGGDASEFFLKDFFEPRTRLRVHVGKMNLIQYWFGKKTLD